MNNRSGGRRVITLIPILLLVDYPRSFIHISPSFSHAQVLIGVLDGIIGDAIKIEGTPLINILFTQPLLQVCRGEMQYGALDHTYPPHTSSVLGCS